MHVPGIGMQVWLCVLLSVGTATGVTQRIPLGNLAPESHSSRPPSWLASTTVGVTSSAGDSPALSTFGVLGACGGPQAESLPLCPLHTFCL